MCQQHDRTLFAPFHLHPLCCPPPLYVLLVPLQAPAATLPAGFKAPNSRVRPLPLADASFKSSVGLKIHVPYQWLHCTVLRGSFVYRSPAGLESGPCSDAKGPKRPTKILPGVPVLLPRAAQTRKAHWLSSMPQSYSPSLAICTPANTFPCHGTFLLKARSAPTQLILSSLGCCACILRHQLGNPAPDS